MERYREVPFEGMVCSIIRLMSYAFGTIVYNPLCNAWLGNVFQQANRFVFFNFAMCLIKSFFDGDFLYLR